MYSEGNAYLAAQIGDVGVGVEGTANGFLDSVHGDCGTKLVGIADSCAC